MIYYNINRKKKNLIKASYIYSVFLCDKGSFFINKKLFKKKNGTWGRFFIFIYNMEYFFFLIYSKMW